MLKQIYYDIKELKSREKKLWRGKYLECENTSERISLLILLFQLGGLKPADCEGQCEMKQERIYSKQGRTERISRDLFLSKYFTTRDPK